VLSDLLHEFVCAFFQQRSFSTSATVAQLVKAPVQVHGVEGRYATALYSAASKNKELEKVDAEMKKIKSLYDSDRPFREFLRDPTLKRVDKKKAIGAVMKKLNHSQTTTNLAGTD
jgi:F-type H+-transporting ATPase subunit O